MSPARLTGKIAVVTGGGSGIGKATALAMARAGAVVAVCDVNKHAALSTTEVIAAAGGRATAHQVDVSSSEQMVHLVDEVLAEHQIVDVVVNNAGIVLNPTPTIEVPLGQFHHIIDVNFWGVVHGSVNFLPHLLKRPKANLINIASNAALMAYGRMAPYCSSKFAVRGFTESLRMELRRSTVHVTLVCPGTTRTSIMANSPVMEDSRRRAMQSQLDSAWARPAESVANRIVKVVERPKPRVLTGPDTNLLDRLVRVLPGRYSTAFGGVIDTFIDKNISGSDGSDRGAPGANPVPIQPRDLT